MGVFLIMSKTNNSFEIKGMTCTACALSVEKAVSKLDGVDSPVVNFATEKLSLEYDESLVSIEDIEAAVEKAGYSMVTEDKDNPSSPKKYEEFKNPYEKKLKFAILFTLPLLIISMGHMVGMPLPNFINPINNPSNFAFTQFLLTIPMVFIGIDFYKVGFRTLVKRSPNMDTLIAIGTSAAIIHGIISLYKIFGGNTHQAMNLYFESASTIITLILLGKYLESISKGKTSDAIKKLINLSPKFATVIRNEKETVVPVENLIKGDLIIVKPGESIPADGIIESGTTTIDESMITGESIPVVKEVGDSAIGATINKNGLIKIRATKVGSETTLSKIITLVENAQSTKAPIARLADVISGYFVPTVITIALISSIIWFVSTKSIDFSMTIFISVLVIACPCALGLATPTAIMVGTGKGAENGILIKSGIALEEAHKIDTIVLDKTGTITNGTPVVTDIINFNGFSKKDILIYAASAEKGSEHPLGEAIVKYAEEEKFEFMNIEKFNSITGHGINAVINSKNILIGNKKLMDDNGIKNSNEDIFTELSSKGVTPIFISIDSKIAGIVGISDVPKKSSKLAIETLKNMGIKVVMITGDNKLTAEAIGKNVGVDEVIAEVLPSDKSKKIEDLQNKGLKLAMVGDGINDAPALAQANVGIAIGSGTDIAIESADIVLMKDDLLDVVKTIELSKATIRNIKQNLFWAFGYNSLGIPIAAGILHVFGGPLLNPMIAAAAMSMSSVSVVSNALRLRGFKSKLDEKDINSETKINFETPKEEIMKKTLIVEGMSCSHCSGRVKKSLEKLPDVISADVNLDTKEATVEMSSEISDEVFKETIDDAGYEVSSIK